MNLQLSENVIEGLKHLGCVIDVELSKKLIANAVKLSLHSDANIPPNPEIYATKSDYAKQSEYAVVSVFFLAIKFNLDALKLRNLLDQKINGLSVDVVEEICRIYELNRNNLMVKNLSAGFTFPHVTDVEWKLQCDVKSSSCDYGSGELNFHINLGNYREKTGEREEIVEFVCNVEELQSLVNKFKEIETHCVKIAGIK